LPRRAQARRGAVIDRALRLVGLAALVACNAPPAKPDAPRFTIEREGGVAVRLVPAAGQLPYCLAFSAADSGTVRLLTMSPKNEALPCPAGKPIGDVTFRIPPDEGHVRLFVVFADTAVEASAIAAQIRELAVKQKKVGGMDLRAPGTIAVGTADFTPNPG
ncbi:MAG TPA: hypothetical protein VHB21_17765, partial [Minicystis sp.]|nr:hypothetical protein [Minicystis sp.]